MVASLMNPAASLVTTDRCSNVSTCLLVSTKCFSWYCSIVVFCWKIKLTSTSNKPPYLVLCYMCPYKTPSSVCWMSPTFQVFHEYRMQHPVGQVPPLGHIQCIKQAPGIKSFSLLSKEITNIDDSWTRNSFFNPNDILIFLYKIALDI